MKLIDILNLIPEDTDFCVELYDDNGELFYGYFIGPKIGVQDRDDLSRELNCEVISLHAGTVRSVNYRGPIPAVSIEIRYPLKTES